LVTSDQAGKGTLNTTTVSGIYSYTSRQYFGNSPSKPASRPPTFQKSLDWSKLTFGDQIDPRSAASSTKPMMCHVGVVLATRTSPLAVLGYTDIFFVGFAATTSRNRMNRSSWERANCP
jgi:hypothetical protein